MTTQVKAPKVVITDAVVTEVINLLASISSSKGEIVKPEGGNTDVVLTLQCATSTVGEFRPVKMTLTQFNAMYNGMVKQWPVIKPMKDEVAIAQRAETKLAADTKRQEAKDAKKAEKDAEKLAAKTEREATIAAAKVAKEAAKVAAKAERDAAAAKVKAEKEAAAAAKVKADTLKAQEAANKLANAAKGAAATATPTLAPKSGKK